MKILIFVLFCCLIQTAKCWAEPPTDSLEVTYDELGLSSKTTAPRGIYSFTEQVALLEGFALGAVRLHSTDLFLAEVRSNIQDYSSNDNTLRTYNWKVTNRETDWSSSNLGGTKKNQRNNFPQMQLMDALPKVMQDRPTNLKYMPNLLLLIKLFAILQIVERIFYEIPQTIQLATNLRLSYRSSKLVLKYTF